MPTIAAAVRSVATIAAAAAGDTTALKDNGGPTDTRALMSNSPAINAGGDALAPPFDQCSLLRASTSDIGAFEFSGEVFRIASTTRLLDGSMVVAGVGVPNAVHSIYASSDLHPPAFTPIGTATANAAGSFQFQDATAAGMSQRFYHATFP
jgi:hypothetical protein